MTGSVGVGLTVLLWFFSDRRVHPKVAESYRGLGLLVWAPILIPVYFVQTRGWRRTLVLTVFVLAVTLLANLLGHWLSRFVVQK